MLIRLSDSGSELAMLKGVEETKKLVDRLDALQDHVRWVLTIWVNPNGTS